MGLKSLEIFEYGSLVKGALKVVLTSGVFVGKRGSQTPRHSATLQVSQDRVALRIIPLEAHRADFDENLELVPNLMPAVGVRRYRDYG